ncbi:hypothetical protein CMV16_14295 [Peribacillus simplex]|nr:hypothetical protein CMV16_14295 [Peribacillus simplex]
MHKCLTDLKVPRLNVTGMVQEKRAGICVYGGKKAREVMKDDLPGFFCNWRGKRWPGFNW